MQIPSYGLKKGRLHLYSYDSFFLSVTVLGSADWYNGLIIP